VMKNIKIQRLKRRKSKKYLEEKFSFRLSYPTRFLHSQTTTICYCLDISGIFNVFSEFFFSSQLLPKSKFESLSFSL
jgi:hypothetical protein